VTALGSIGAVDDAGTGVAPRAALWGLGPAGLHDRFWVSRRVQVVRAGAGAETVDAPGPALYLLLDPHQWALFDLTPVARRMAWLKPRAVRLRILEPAGDAYRERVEADADGRLIRISRDYAARTRATTQVILTADARLARQWAENPGGRACRRALYRACGREGVAPLTVTGLCADARRPDDLSRATVRLLDLWRRPEDVIDDVYLYDTGVRVHAGASVAPGARLIGPVWVGAGVRLGADAVVVGPAVLHDRAHRPAPEPPAWEDLATATWRLTARPITAKRLFGKRAFDVVFSLAVLAVTLPAYPVIMLAIMIEDGWPVFFAHRRQTLRGRAFPCLKFRTMRRDAEAMKAQLARLNQADGPQFFIEDDPRMLRVGRFLRATQLDEIPQFINVLLGHMSVVGPRPSPDQENQFCPAWREARLSVRPGVTGLWQIRRTREPQTDFQEWIRYDLQYVQHRSWRLDLLIILKTVTKIFGAR